jgi:AcrR family transcriptional regulator
MISLSGTHGYRNTTIDALCGLAEVDRSEFDARFADREDCYVAAHDETAEEFGERVFKAFRSQVVWHDSMWATAWAALAFLQEDPVRARFFAIEVNGAGARAQVRRDRVLQVVADLVDRGRCELDDPDSMTRGTAEIVAGAIYSTIQQKIMDGSLDSGEGFLVELVYIAVLPYLGTRAAEAELRVQPLR